MRITMRRAVGIGVGVAVVAVGAAMVGKKACACSGSEFAEGSRAATAASTGSVSAAVTAVSADRAEDKAKITAVLTAQQAAWNRSDVDAFIVGYWESPELTFSGSGGIARGFAGVRERYHRNYPDRAAMGELAFSDLEFRFIGADAALVLGHWHLKREQKGDVGGVFSLVWQRFPDGWKIIHDHTSSVDGM